MGMYGTYYPSSCLQFPEEEQADLLAYPRVPSHDRLVVGCSSQGSLGQEKCNILFTTRIVHRPDNRVGRVEAYLNGESRCFQGPLPLAIMCFDLPEYMLGTHSHTQKHGGLCAAASMPS